MYVRPWLPSIYLSSIFSVISVHTYSLSIIFPGRPIITALSLEATMTSDNAKAAEEGRLSPTGSEPSRDDAKDPEKDPFLVTWNGTDDPENPKNWTKHQKWAATFVSIFPCKHILAHR